MINPHKYNLRRRALVVIFSQDLILITEMVSQSTSGQLRSCTAFSSSTRLPGSCCSLSCPPQSYMETFCPPQSYRETSSPPQSYKVIFSPHQNCMEIFSPRRHSPRHACQLQSCTGPWNKYFWCMEINIHKKSSPFPDTEVVWRGSLDGSEPQVLHLWHNLGHCLRIIVESLHRTQIRRVVQISAANRLIGEVVQSRAFS